MSDAAQPLPPLVIRRRDYAQLDRLVSSLGDHAATPAAAYLEREIMRADIAEDDVPGDVVTMHSQVTYRDAASDAARTVTLVYPHEADIAQQRISVLTPIGAALIGMRVGSDIVWYKPDGSARTLHVLGVKQPQAALETGEGNMVAREGFEPPTKGL